MPIYQYQCANCNYRFALLEPIGSAENNKECPKCGSRQTRRTISPFSTSAPCREAERLQARRVKGLISPVVIGRTN